MMESLPTLTRIVSIMGIIGIPSIFAMTIWCIRSCIKFTKTLNYLMIAEKSDIRNQLIKDFKEYEARGSITDLELNEWVNRYNAYHNLIGENGVLDDRYKKILQLANK